MPGCPCIDHPDGHSSRETVARPLWQPTRGCDACAPWSKRAASRRLFGLAPAGVYPATAVTGGAVRSYRTFSPLPDPARPKSCGPSAVCSLWHCPSPRSGRSRRAAPRRYLATCPVEPGLSSTGMTRVATVRPMTPTGGIYRARVTAARQPPNAQRAAIARRARTPLGFFMAERHRSPTSANRAGRVRRVKSRGSRESSSSSHRSGVDTVAPGRARTE